MPYQPGVQDISGQLRAQGIQQGIGGLIDGFKQYQQNSMMTKQALAKFSGIAKANPTVAQAATAVDAPPEIAKAIKKFESGKSLTVGEAGALATFAETVDEQQKRQQMAQVQALQMQQVQQQLAAGQAELQQAQKLSQLSQLSQGVGKGVLRPEVQQRMTQEMQDPVIKFAMRTQAATGKPPTPNNVQQFLETNQAAERRPAPIIASNMAELEKRYPRSEFDYKVTPLPDGKVAIPDGIVNTRAPSAEKGLKMVPGGSAIMVYDESGKLVRKDVVDPQIPVGYERDPKTGGIAPIPGSPAEIEAKVANQRERMSAMATAAQADVMTNAIKDVLPKIDSSTIGVGAIFSAIPNTPAYDLAAKLDTLKANIGFQQLAQMRQASPTGGALGQVAVKELDFLQAALGNLDKWQSPKQLKDTLISIQNHLNRWQKTMQGINPDEKPDAKKVGNFIVEEETK